MKKSEITKKFLINKMKDAAMLENEEYFQSEFKKLLLGEIECLEELAKEEEEDDELESAENTRKSIERIKEELKFNVTFDDFQNVMTEVNGYYEETEIEKQYLYEQNKSEYIEKCANRYMNVIENFPDDVEYKINFSNRSQSIYLVTDLPVTDENIEKFTTDKYYCNINYDDEYTTDTVKIRLSDHNFGGNIEVSYESPCVNIVVM